MKRRDNIKTKWLNDQMEWDCWSYHGSLLLGALFVPAQLGEGQLGGDGVGQRQLVVGACGPLQFQTCKRKPIEKQNTVRSGGF